jgi:predicted RNase H-like HicB family nuclease
LGFVFWRIAQAAEIVIFITMKSKFNAVIKKDSNWWIGWVEEIPGVNSQGKTKAALLKNLRSALTEALEFNREDARNAAQNDYEEAAILV